MWISLNVSYFNTLGNSTHMALHHGSFKHMKLIYMAHSVEQHQSSKSSFTTTVLLHIVLNNASAHAIKLVTDRYPGDLEQTAAM